MNKKLLGDALKRPDVASFKNQAKIPVKVLLDDIRSLSNVGSIFRTCDAFNVDELMLCGITGRPPHRDIQRTALGATESVKWTYCEEIEAALDDLNESYERVFILSVEQCEMSIQPQHVLAEISDQLRTDCMILLVLGNEVNGVRQTVINRSDYAIEIPQSGTKHSLNVTVAAGVVLWELYKDLEASDY